LFLEDFLGLSILPEANTRFHQLSSNGTQSGDDQNFKTQRRKKSKKIPSLRRRFQSQFGQFPELAFWAVSRACIASSRASSAFSRALR
jgi:hypothetical protein